MKLLVPRSLLREIEEQARAPGTKREAGGLLLGLRKKDAIHITRLTYPTRWDHATPTLFARSALGHRITALRAWKASKGFVDWVGEWHTHPFGASAPSHIDVASWRKLARHSRKPMAFFIAGKADFFVGLQFPAHHQIRRLNSIEIDDEFELFA